MEFKNYFRRDGDAMHLHFCPINMCYRRDADGDRILCLTLMNFNVCGILLGKGHNFNEPLD